MDYLKFIVSNQKDESIGTQRVKGGTKISCAGPGIVTLCNQMNFPIQINTTEMGLSIIYFKGSKDEISKLRCASILKNVFIVANSADTDEMLHFATFHPGLYCLLKYPFRGFQNTRGLFDQY